MNQLDREEFAAARSAREPMFNAPTVVVALCAVLIALFVVQASFGVETSAQRYGLNRDQLMHGRWWTLLTSMFLHGGWLHVLLNCVALFAFGPATARLLGGSARGTVSYLAFYLACGLLSGLAYVALVADIPDPKDGGFVPIVGASGAISGLIGATARIIEGHGRIGPILGRSVIGMTVAWTIANVLLGATGLTPGAYGVYVAWQAHLAGYAAGVILIGPFARLAGLGETAFTQ